MDKIKNINDQTDHSQVKETEKKKKIFYLKRWKRSIYF